mgnify:CR=1 FL=1
MSQLHGINGAQQPQATGISPSVGKLGLHSVQLGTNPPVRLDAIKGNKIPFAGFRTATKVVNGGKSCGILGLAKCGVGTLTADKLVLNSSQKYVSDMGGKQYFKSTEVNTVK